MDAMIDATNIQIFTILLNDSNINLMGSSMATSMSQCSLLGSRESLDVAKQVPQSRCVSGDTLVSAVRMDGTIHSHSGSTLAGFILALWILGFQLEKCV